MSRWYGALTFRKIDLGQTICSTCLNVRLAFYATARHMHSQYLFGPGIKKITKVRCSRFLAISTCPTRTLE